MGQVRPRLRLVPPVPAIDVPVISRKAFSFDIIQVDSGSGMMTIDACIPVAVGMQILKLLEPYV